MAREVANKLGRFTKFGSVVIGLIHEKIDGEGIAHPLLLEWVRGSRPAGLQLGVLDFVQEHESPGDVGDISHQLVGRRGRVEHRLGHFRWPGKGIDVGRDQQVACGSQVSKSGCHMFGLPGHVGDLGGGEPSGHQQESRIVGRHACPCRESNDPGRGRCAMPHDDGAERRLQFKARLVGRLDDLNVGRF